VQLVRAVTRTALGSAQRSPFVRVTQGRKVRVKLDRKVPYELDGGDRKKVKSFKVDVEAGAITVCVPPAAEEGVKRNEPQRQGEGRR
jgi:diacylglycerol kinase family enzyme